MDAIFRAFLMSPAAVAARMVDVEGPMVAPEGRQFSEAQAQLRLQRRLEDAERAAERALAWQEPVAAARPEIQAHGESRPHPARRAWSSRGCGPQRKGTLSAEMEWNLHGR